MGFGLGTYATHRDRTRLPKRSLVPSFKVTIRGPGHIDVLCDRGAFSYRAGKVESYSSILSCRAIRAPCGCDEQTSYHHVERRIAVQEGCRD